MASNLTQATTESQDGLSYTILPWVIVTGVTFVVALILTLVLTTERGVFDTTPKVLGGEFTLQGKNGDISLSDFKGKVVLLYFGFLHCPEVCPASMAIYQQTLNSLTQTELKQVQPLLITIDPKRDSAKDLDEFGQYYHNSIMGLTGTEASIRSVANQYGAYFNEVPMDAKVEYIFDHTSRYYVIDKNGKLIDAMRHSTTSNELTARIRSLL